MKELLAGIVVAILSVFGGHQAVTQSASNAAAAAASVAPSAIVATSSFTNSSGADTMASSTIVYQTINQPVIERIIGQQSASTGVSESELDTKLSALENKLTNLFYTGLSNISSSPAPNTIASGGVWNAIAGTNKIDQLSRVSISNSTIDTASIPDLSGSYLSTSGGTLAGLLHLTSASSSQLSIFSNAYFGGTATSSFDSSGALTLASALTVPNGGTGWANIVAGSIPYGNGSSALATSSQFAFNGSALTVPLRDKGGQLYNVKAYGAVGDGVADDSTAVLAAITAAYNAGGGTVYFPTGTYLITSQIAIPNNGAGANAKQPPLTLRGEGGEWDGSWNDLPSSASVLDLRYNGTAAKILTQGYGSLTVQGLAIADKGTSSLPFLYTTYTTLFVRDNAFVGNPSKFGNTSDQDAIVLGGLGNVFDGSVNAPFAGYGTVIERNYFSRIRRGIYGGTYANAVVISNNTWSASSGATSAAAAIEFDGTAGIGASGASEGNTISGNIFELVHYVYAINFKNAKNNSVVGNGFYDERSGFIAIIHTWGTASGGNLLIGSEINAATSTQITYDENGAAPVTSLIGSKARGFFSFAGGDGNFEIRPEVPPAAETAVLLRVARSNADTTNPGVNILTLTQQGVLNLTGKSASPAASLIISNSGTQTTYDHNSIVTNTGNLSIYPGAASTNAVKIARGYFGIPSIATASRAAATNFSAGTMYWDTTLSQPVWSDGTAWRTDVGILNANGNMGIGTTSPYAILSISNSASTLANTPLFVIASTTGGVSTTTVLSVASTGNVTITGSAATCTLGNGSSATNCSSSDQRLKDDITSLDASSSLATIRQLNPVSFKWNAWMVGNGSPTITQYGFIAQQVAPIYSNLVTEDPNTHYYKLDYQGLFAPIVGAIQALAQKVAALTDSFTTKELTFTRATGDDLTLTHQLCIQKSDGTPVCVTGDQLAAVLASQGSSGSSSPSSSAASSSPSPDTEAPVITIDGENPAHIHVGDSYADLGASVTDNMDQNLGLKTFLNGALVSNIVIDTSAAATDTIDYVASDSAGNTSTSTRTVIVESPATAEPAPAP